MHRNIICLFAQLHGGKMCSFFKIKEIK